MEHEFPFETGFETFRLGNKDYLFRRSVAPGNFKLKLGPKSCFIHFSTEFFWNISVNVYNFGKQPTCITAVSVLFFSKICFSILYQVRPKKN